MKTALEARLGTPPNKTQMTGFRITDSAKKQTKPAATGEVFVTMPNTHARKLGTSHAGALLEQLLIKTAKYSISTKLHGMFCFD